MGFFRWDWYWPAKRAGWTKYEARGEPEIIRWATDGEIAAGDGVEVIPGGRLHIVAKSWHAACVRDGLIEAPAPKEGKPGRKWGSPVAHAAMDGGWTRFKDNGANRLRRPARDDEEPEGYTEALGFFVTADGYYAACVRDGLPIPEYATAEVENLAGCRVVDVKVAVVPTGRIFTLTSETGEEFVVMPANKPTEQ